MITARTNIRSPRDDRHKLGERRLATDGHRDLPNSPKGAGLGGASLLNQAVAREKLFRANRGGRLGREKNK